MIPTGIVAGSGQGTFPSAVTISSISNTYDSATLNWTAPFNGGAPITGYSYQISTDNVNFGIAVSAGAGTSVGVSGLNPATTYYFRMSATNSIGTGPYGSSSSTATPKASTLVSATTAEPLALPYGAMSGRSIPDSSPFYISISSLRRSNGALLSGKTGQIQFSVFGTWYNLGGATITTDASGNGSRNFWYLPGTGSPSDSTVYTSGYNGQTAQGSNISTYGWVEDIQSSIYWRVAFPEDSQNLAVTSGAVELSTYYSGT